MSTLTIKGAGTGMFSQESLPIDPPAAQPAAEAARPAFRRQEPGAASVPATDRQKAYLRTLLAEREDVAEAEAVRVRLNEWRLGPNGLTKVGASKAIDDLLKIAKARTDLQPVADLSVGARPLDLPIWPGRYTLIDGVNGHRTFRVRVQPSDEDFAPGESIIEYLSGRDNHSDYTGFGFVKPGPRVVVWKKHRGNANLMEDLARFLAADRDDEDQVLQIVQCARCGDDLSVPSSIRQGFGPVCITKGLR